MVTKRWRVETMAMVRRHYEVEALNADDAEVLVANDMAPLVFEDDVNEDIDSVDEIASPVIADQSIRTMAAIDALTTDGILNAMDDLVQRPRTEGDAK